jgi:hypothetical protein
LLKIAGFFKSRWLTAALVLVLAMLTSYYVTLTSLEKKLAAQVSELKKAGKPTEIREMMPTELNVPYDENAAPLYEAATKLIKWDVSYVSPSGAAREAEDFYLKNTDAIKTTLKRNEKVFAFIREAGEKPRCRYELDYKQGFMMKLPDYKNSRDVSSYCAFKAIDEMHGGRSREAADTITGAFRFARSLANGASFRDRHLSLIGLMICNAMIKITITPAELMAEKGIKAPYGQLIGEIDAYLAESEGAFEKSLDTERVMVMPLFMELAAGGRSESSRFAYNTWVLEDATNTLKSADPWTRLKYRLRLRTVILSDEIYYLQFMENAIQAIRNNDVNGMEQLYKTSEKDSKRQITAWVFIPNIRRAYEVHSGTLERLKAVRDKLAKLSAD